MKINNYLWIFLIAIVTVTTGNGAPVKDFFPGQEREVIQNGVIRRFYGPWNNIQKVNGEYSDYNDYGAPIQDYQPSSQDVPANVPTVAEGPVADFPSNYGLTGTETDTGYDPNQSGLASFYTADSTGDAHENSGEETSGNIWQDNQSSDSQDNENNSQPDKTSNGDNVDPQESDEYNHEEAEGNVHWTSPI